MTEPAPPPLPAWADPVLSSDLHQLAAAGESQGVEFKAIFPSHVGDIAKEIAAFASSNDGTVYIGIADDGEIVGIEDGSNGTVRESLRQRIEGLCSGPVKPLVTPTIRFALHNDKTVMAIGVSKGAAPIYYANNVPYLRHLTAARPMSPQDVIDAVLEWHGRQGAVDPKEAYLSNLASLIINIEVHIGESQIRRLKPWAEETRWMLKSLADQARDLAIETPLEFADIRPELEAIGESLDVIAHERSAINRPRTDILAAVDAATNRAAAIRERWLPARSFSKESVEGLRQTVRAQTDKLAQLVSRSQTLIAQHRLDELRGDASQIGLILLTAATFGIGLGDEGELTALVEIARGLRELETRSIYHDGGASVQRVLDDLTAANKALAAWIAQHLDR